MKKILKFNLLILIIIILTLKICTLKKVKTKTVSYFASNYSSEAYIVMNVDTKEIFVQKNINKVMLPASLTKILTTITALEYMNLNKYYKIKKEYLSIEGSKIYLEENDFVKGIDLLYGVMLRSGNDAANMIAHCYGKCYNDFISKMNFVAKKIGMTYSTFNNPTGLDDLDSNFTTAYDLAILMSYAIQNKTFYEIVNKKTYIFSTLNNSYLLVNKHKLIHQNKYFIGGKTGYTKKAKRTLISCFEQFQTRIVIVTLNATNDWELHQELANITFNKINKEI